MNPRKFSILTLIFTTFFWGSTFVLVKSTVAIIPLDGFITIRFSLATILLFFIAISDKQSILSLKKRCTWSVGTLLGLLLYFSFWFQTEGLVLTSPAKAAFITGLNVVLVPILGIYPFKNIITKFDWILGIISLFGLALLSLDFANITKVNQGDILILVTAICVAYHVLFTEKYNNIDIKALVFVQMVIISLCSLTMSLFRSSYWIPQFNEPQIVWITVIVTAVLATAFAFTSQTYAQQVGVKSTHIALIFVLEPVFALLIDILIKNYPSSQSIFGMILILFSMILIARNEMQIND